MRKNFLFITIFSSLFISGYVNVPSSQVIAPSVPAVDGVDIYSIEYKTIIVPPDAGGEY
ncbi:MAG TPA: hypothetical protein VIO11_10215 [Candidatus Methanoperedens sp.]